MGLFTAYHASQLQAGVVVLEKSHVGDPQTASFGLTRSYRNDYLDPTYARLAYEARRLWREIEAHAEEALLVECGCLNIASAAVTPDLDATYAARVHETLGRVGLKREAFARHELAARYPQFDVDLGRLDVEAGFVYVPAVTRTLRASLAGAGVRVVENAEVSGVVREGDTFRVASTGGEVRARRLVVTAGHGTNEVLARLGSPLRFPITLDRPRECKYVIPPPGRRDTFLAFALPVFAYLDVGIYGHPIYDGKTPGVKIGYYDPPDVETRHTTVHDVRSFIERCLPALAGAEAVDVTDVDQCYYDLVGDDEFILGPVPGEADVTVGVGWRGTGYKYAPWVGRALAQIALTGGTVYDVARFAPSRFRPAGSG
jgi:sarcosine oxidase